MYYCISIKRSILCLLQGKINCHKQCVNQNFEFFILNSKAVLTFYSICNIFRNFEYTSYSICTIYFGNFNFNIFSYKRNPNSGKTKLVCIVKMRKHYIYAILLISAACIDCFTQKDNRCPFWLHLSDLYTGILCWLSEISESIKTVSYLDTHVSVYWFS